MKKLTLFALALSMTFGVFAQNLSVTPRNSNQKQAPKMEIQKNHRGLTPSGFVATKGTSVKAPGGVISGVSSFEDWANGGFTLNYTFTMNDETYGYDPFAMVTSAIDENYPNGDQDIIDETINLVQQYKEFYEGYGYEWSDDYYYRTESGEMQITGLQGGTDYTLIIVCKGTNGTDYVVVKEEFTTPVSAKSGEAKMSTANVSGITQTDAFLTVAKNDQTAYYNILFGTSEIFDNNNISDEQDCYDYLAQNANASKYTQDTTWELGAESLSDQYALKPNTEYTVYIAPFNGNSECVVANIVKIVFTTLSSSQNGVAAATLDVDHADVPLNWKVSVNDQTAYFKFYCQYVETLQEFIDQYYPDWTLEEAALDDINYYESQYSWLSFTYADNDAINDVWAEGWLYPYLQEPVEFAKGDELFAVVVPFNGNGDQGTVVTKQFIIGEVSLDNVKDGVLVNVYPNPASEYIQVIGLNGMQKVEILNTLGQTVYAQDTKVNGMNINVRNFEKGTYFVKVTANGKVSTQKVVVK